MNIIYAIIATYGIATLLAEYDGPFNVLSKLRNRGMPNCNVCMGVWIAIPLALFLEIGLIGYFVTIGGVVILGRLV
jgi:hypothetical protein